MNNIINLLPLLSYHKYIIFVLLFLCPPVHADQVESKILTTAKEYGYFSSENWCEDQTTIVFSKNSLHKNYFSGLRLIFEPQFGVLFQNGDNRFKGESIDDLPRFGVETNLYKAWISVQAGLLYPSTIEFEEKSPIVEKHELKYGGNIVGIDYGYSMGFSFLDGIIAIGYGYVKYDKRLFSSSYQGNFKGNFWYFNIQPATLVRSLVKNLKD